MHTLFEELRKCHEQKLHQISILIACALPDICAALESENGRTCGEKYKNWCTRNLQLENFSRVTAEELYSLRCRLVHQGSGNFAPSNETITESNEKELTLLFFDKEKEESRMKVGGIIKHDTGDYKLVEIHGFIEGIINSATTWWDLMAKQQNVNVRKNHLALLKRYENGLPWFPLLGAYPIYGSMPSKVIGYCTQQGGGGNA
jgi:hypothetical protein